MADKPNENPGNEVVSIKPSKPRGRMLDVLLRERSREELTRHVRIAVTVMFLGNAIPLCEWIKDAHLRMELDARNDKELVEALLKSNPNVSVLDEKTGNALCGSAASNRSDEGLERGLSCDLEFISRETVVEKIGRANEAMRAFFESNKGTINQKLWGQYQCIRILSSTRTNLEQSGMRWDWDKWSVKFEWLIIPTGISHKAAEECFSFHESGWAIDVDNWQVAKPFLEGMGFVQHPKEPWHFSIGEHLKNSK